MNDNDDLDRSYEHTREAELHRDARLWRENARALWAVRVLDAAEQAPYGCRYTWTYGVEVKMLLVTYPSGARRSFEGDTRMAARIAAAEALVANDPSLGEGLASTNHREGVTREMVAEQYDKRQGAPAHGCTEHDFIYGTCRNCGHFDH
jgi:hypothetical protein